MSLEATLGFEFKEDDKIDKDLSDDILYNKQILLTNKLNTKEKEVFIQTSQTLAP